ncbi:MAG: O-antigen ligase family protein [Patescibacteria group bacterium]
MKEQFFGKTFWLTMGALVATYVLTYFVQHTGVEPVALLVIALITLAATLHKLENGLFIAFAELIATSHGHLLNAGPISIRMAIFGAVMLGWGVHILRGRRLNLGQPLLRPYYLLLLAVVLGFLIGWQSNIHHDVIDDGNGYFYVLYIFPVLTVAWDALKRRTLVQVFASASTFISLLTLVILYLFTHTSEPTQRILYKFFRDARVAELTRVVDDIFRIFLQAQFFDVVFVLILASAAFWFWRNRRDQNIIAGGIILTLSTLIISLSRSFWIGIIAGGVALAVCVMIIRRPSFKEIAVKKLAGVVMVATSVALLWIVLAFPFPAGGNVSGFGDLLSDRTLQGDDVAITSRWKLLPAMTQSISESPILGKGFGTVVAFESDDPFVRERFPDGMWRTYAFEWGWLDTWLKMGMLGLIAILWLGIMTAKGLGRGFKGEHGWLTIGFFAGLVALYATHTFSPYLNHPIGLGYLIFLTPFLTPSSKKAPKGAMVHIKEVIAAKAPSASVASGSMVSFKE